MIVAESRHSRRLVGRLDLGAELLTALTEICRLKGVRSAELRVFGSVEEVELQEFDEAGRAFRPPRRFPSAFTVVQCVGQLGELAGRLHLEATCTLSRERDNGIELLGGRLVRARVHAIEFVIDSFDDLLLRRTIDPVTGLVLLTEALPLSTSAPVGDRVPRGVTAPGSAPEPPRSPEIPFDAPARGHVAGAPHPYGAQSAAAARPVEAAPRPVEADPGPSWSEVAALSAEQPPALESEDEDQIRQGDVIEHPRFGRCEVERIEGEAEYAQVRLRNHRLVRLSLDVIQLVRDGLDEEGHRRYRAMVLR